MLASIEQTQTVNEALDGAPVLVGSAHLVENPLGELGGLAGRVLGAPAHGVI
jgi:hypothetical protein